MGCGLFNWKVKSAGRRFSNSRKNRNGTLVPHVNSAPATGNYKDAPTAEATDKPLPSFMTSYMQRTYAHDAFLIASHDEISRLAHERTKHIIEAMVTPEQASDLRKVGSAIVIVGVHEKLTEIPGFEFLADDPNFNWNNTDGCGATDWVPVSTIFERHLLHTPEDTYIQENILVHEFAHHVMDMWIAKIHPDWITQLHDAWNSAKQNTAYLPDCYATRDPSEYFAEGAQLFFNATGRTDKDSTGGMTHARLPHADPQLFRILRRVFTQPWDCVGDMGRVCYVTCWD
jgi:alpha-glucosidase